ncbi:unnamed protein product [Urochloa decumbens]|uniref:Uncharacterized protein n=1 Tax=Urochloa decumbens TaxID=240449 RepID=A0ABC8VGG3_9POAL
MSLASLPRAKEPAGGSRAAPAPAERPRPDRTAKTLKKNGGIDCTRGLSREQRAINRRKKLELSLTSGCSDGLKVKDFSRAIDKMLRLQRIRQKWADAENKRRADEAVRFGILPERAVSNTPFEEEPFGDPVTPGMHLPSDVSSIVVSLALFDEHELLFVCSGISLPSGATTKLDAVLGGPLIGNGAGNIAKILGVNLALNHDKYTFLPLELLRERLEHFQILNPEVIPFKKYSCPEGVSRIIPSGFMATINRIKSLGYPLPPPLVLEFNGELLNRFEGYFGELHAWKGYRGIIPWTCYTGHVWSRLQKNVLNKISRCVVSLASFNDGIRSFVCTGLLIRLCGRTVILTSASLVCDNDKGGIIDDKKLKIEVFLPPQCRSGTLDVYNLKYNIAIVSVKKAFCPHCTENIFKAEKKSSEEVDEGSSSKNQKSSEKVVAIGRSTDELLMGTIGKVMPTNKDRKLDCDDLKVSTCKINKAAIGGPLINLDGSFVGMNFYDGRGGTPFLPKREIVKVLDCYYNDGTSPRHIYNDGSPPRINSWCVPPPYWYHGELDVDWYDMPIRRRGDVGLST